MAKQKFDIVPGIYNVPNIGRIDCTGPLIASKSLELYLNKHFVKFIKLNEAGVSFMKKQKLSAKVVSALINRSTSLKEVELLIQVNDSDTVKRIGTNKIESLG